MVFIVVCVWLLLEVSPPTDILQALRRVPNLNKAHGLQERRDGRGISFLWTVWRAGQVIVLTDPIHWGPVHVAQWPLPNPLRTCFPLGSILCSPVSFHTKSLCSFQVRSEFSAHPIYRAPCILSGTYGVQALDRRQMPCGLHPEELTSWEGFRAGGKGIPM